jgi:hypothetical protein
MTQSKIGTTDSADLIYKSGLNEQIARMRHILELMSDGSASAALGAMRKACPDVPLAERVRALTQR